MSDMELYSRYFPVGRKIGVGIPLPNAEVFKDWAIILELDEDLITLQLSRDILPVSVDLEYGQILELRGGNGESGYCCRAIVVSEGDASRLLLRLIGEIVSDELREFYRIDAFLPIKFFVSREQNIDRLRRHWEEQRVRRYQSELQQKDVRWSINTQPGHAELPAGASHSVEAHGNGEKTAAHESWDSIIPLAANISGGGLRIITHQEFEYGEFIILEILVPAPQRVVDVIGMVVFANRNYASGGGDREHFNTGVQFVCIDEGDRDAVINYISTIQLKRIQQLREQYLYRSVPENQLSEPEFHKPSVKRTAVVAVTVFLVVILMIICADYLWYYAHEHPKGEIQRNFEDSVKKYRDQLLRNP